jgi:multidrug efflux system outer membrane protein
MTVACSARWLAGALGALLIAGATSAASAQPSPKPQAGAPGAPPAKPGAAPGALGTAPATPMTPDPPTPIAPPVSDPMLSPPEDAGRHIASWDEALSLIRSQSPDYVTAYQSVLRAEAQKRVALAAVLPTLSVQGSYVHQFYTESVPLLTGTPNAPQAVTLVSPAPDTFTFSVAANWNILNPRSIYEVGTASRAIEVQKLSFSEQRRQIALAIVHTMLATLAAERVSDVNRVGLRSGLERLVLTQTREQYGQGTALDVDRGQQDVESARSLIINSDESLREAREALGQALASPTPISPPGDLDLETFESAVARTCKPNDDIERRPDVLAARGKVDLAQRAVRDAELLFAPYINVQSEFQDSNVAVLGPTKNWDLGATITLPLFDGGARYGVLRDAKAQLEQSREALVTARLGAVVGSATALRLVGVRQAARDVAKQQRDLAKRIDDRTRDGYAHGLGTSLDLVTSAAALRQAEIDLAILDFQVAEARADAVLTNGECLY